MSKKTLESLLTAYQKAERLYAETEALKPRLEKEIADALATGDALNEQTANALQTKRGQLDLVPAKLAQIHARMEALLAEIKAESAFCLSDLQRQLNGASAAFKENIGALLRPLMSEDWMLEHVAQTIFNHTKLDVQISGIIGRVAFPFAQGDSRLAALNLSDANKQASVILESAKAFAATIAQAATEVEALAKATDEKLHRLA